MAATENGWTPFGEAKPLQMLELAEWTDRANIAVAIDATRPSIE